MITFSRLDAPKNTSVFTIPSGVITKGSSVTLTCSSDANPPVENYTWFKVGESTPVGSGEQYSITSISSEDGGQYYCEARNKYGAEDSTAVSIMEGISDRGQYNCETRNTYGAGNSSNVSVIVEGISASLSLCAYDNNCLRSLYLTCECSPHLPHVTCVCSRRAESCNDCCDNSLCLWTIGSLLWGFLSVVSGCDRENRVCPSWCESRCV